MSSEKALPEINHDLDDLFLHGDVGEKSTPTTDDDLSIYIYTCISADISYSSSPPAAARGSVQDLPAY